MATRRHRQRGVTLIEILFATMILGIGLISIIVLFPVGMLIHQKSIQDEKATLIVQSLEDAISAGCKYAKFDRNGHASIMVVHDGMYRGIIPSSGMPDGKAEIDLPDTAMPLTRQDMQNPNSSDPPSGFDIKYERNEPIRLPDDAGKSVYPLGRTLLQAGSKYYNKLDDLSGYSFDIRIREAVSMRRYRSNYLDYRTEDPNSQVNVYELASQGIDVNGNLASKHDEYEFTIRVYVGWRPSSKYEQSTEENATLVRVYSFVASISR